MNWTEFLRQQNLAAETGQPLDINSLSELSDKAIIDITGTDAIAFLHGQFTGHIESLPADQAMLTAWCNPKGRVLATILLCRRDDGLRLLVSADQHAA
ncbi:MAG: folate-binding protein, partial [Gammaproteobacteria bacterium]